MTHGHNAYSLALIRTDSPLRVGVVVCLVALVSYFAARLGGALVIRPEMIWPVWPGCAFLVAALLLTPRKIWPWVLAAGIAGFALYDVQERLSFRATVFLLAADSIEILVAAFGVSYVFRGVPHLNNVTALTKYSIFAVILAPVSVASAAAIALEGDSWWIGFFTEALALLTLTPAILAWADVALTQKKPKSHYIEGILLCAGLTTLAYVAFLASGNSSRPALLYSLVPFLLWAALRFGIIGASSSMVIVCFLATVGATHGRGPFAGNTPVKDVLALQLFLLVASGSFMVLAAVVEGQKRAEETVRESEKRFQLATQSREELLKIFVKNVPAGVAMLDREMRYLQVSDRWCADYGVNASQLLGYSHYEVFPDIPQRWKEIHRHALEGKTLRAEDDRWDRQDGRVTWVRWEVRPWKSSSGNIGGLLIFAEDITQRKQIEEAISGMSRKLIDAQEQERARIGRELHDDINQRLALLGVELQQLQDNPSEVQSHVEELRKELAEISNDVQGLSHELHSSKLEYLGVVAGIRSWCKEFGERQRMEVAFTNGVSSDLSLEIGVCLFRVLQEALHNAVKHSGVKRFAVQLQEDSDGIHLIVTDSGRGFDMEAASKGKGLGLTSMGERVRLVNGTISIESKPKSGTTIHVRVPLTSQQAAQRAAG